MKCSNRPDAFARIQGGADAPGLSGTVRFYQRREDVLITAEINGLPAENTSGFFGFHIHSGMSCTGEGFADTLGHYDPDNTPHPQHAGDLPPLLSCNGRAYLSFTTDRFRVRDVIGRTVVIHGHADDFRSQPAGDAGTKAACGVIRRR